MVQNGIQKTKRDHRDYSFHKTFGTTRFDVGSLPQEFNIDAGLWMPDQNAFGLPFGCTGFTQGDLIADQDKEIPNPAYIYDATPPHDRSLGRSLRASFKVICDKDMLFPLLNDPTKTLKPRPKYFSVKPAGRIDWFDAVRIAIFVNQHEFRSVSVGSPWFSEWNNAGSGTEVVKEPNGTYTLRVAPQGKSGILPAPAKYTWGVIGHNWKISGWKVIDGVEYLIGKPWQGENFGDNGWVYVSREIFNKTMQVNGSSAFTVADDDAPIKTVGWDIIEIIVSFIRDLWQFGTQSKTYSA